MQRIALDFVSQNFSDNTTQEQGRRGKNLCLWKTSQPDENSTLYLLRLEYKPSFHFSLLLQIYANTLTNSAAHLRGEGVATEAPKCDRESGGGRGLSWQRSMGWICPFAGDKVAPLNEIHVIFLPLPVKWNVSCQGSKSLGFCHTWLMHARVARKVVRK